MTPLNEMGNKDVSTILKEVAMAEKTAQPALDQLDAMAEKLHAAVNSVGQAVNGLIEVEQHPQEDSPATTANYTFAQIEDVCRRVVDEIHRLGCIQSAVMNFRAQLIGPEQSNLMPRRPLMEADSYE